MEVHTLVRPLFPLCSPTMSGKNICQSSEEPRGGFILPVLQKQYDIFTPVKPDTGCCEWKAIFEQLFANVFALDGLLSPWLPEETQVISAAFSAYKGLHDETKHCRVEIESTPITYCLFF